MIMGNSIKGLLIKDWKLLYNQKQTWFIVLLFYVIFCFLQNAVFAIAYCTVMFASIAVSTIAYDGQGNGTVHLFIMPITRKDYVKGKYIFAILCTGVPWLIMNICSYIIGNIRAEDINLTEYLAVNIMVLLLAFVVVAIEIPIQLKYGAEKSRIALVLFLGMLFLVAYLLKDIVTELYNSIPSINLESAVWWCAVGILVLVLISYNISRHIVEQKEF